jgi:hypothetical protein
MSVNLYHTWLTQLGQLSGTVRIPVLRNFAWLMLGLFESHSVHLHRIADELPWQVKVPSATRRLSRLLANAAVRVRDWYEPIARQLVETQACSLGEIRLIVDGTQIGFNHQLLIVCIAIRRRALPIAWTWVPYKRGHSSACRQLALLKYVHKLMPADIPILLVGDSEFGHVPVLKQLDKWRWRYVLRQKSSYLVRSPSSKSWVDLGFLAKGPGHSQWLQQILLTEKYQYQVNLLIYWHKGEKEPWLLATNLSDLRSTLAAYRRRMWIEEMFADFKRHGFDLASTHLQHFQRLSRLTLAVALLYVWHIAIGTYAIKRGWRHWVDRKDRRDLSIFRIGHSMIKRHLKFDQFLPFRLSPYFS